MNVEIGTEAAQFPDKEYKWDFRCIVGCRFRTACGHFDLVLFVPLKIIICGIMALFLPSNLCSMYNVQYSVCVQDLRYTNKFDHVYLELILVLWKNNMQKLLVICHSRNTPFFLSNYHPDALFPVNKLHFLCLLLRETAASYRTQNLFETKNKL